jgi:F0F1-type ATP synthase membrane subunit b/b'
MSKNIDEKVDQLEAAIDPNTVITVGGYSFTPARLMIAGTILTTVLGGLYGAFEIYKDYMDMKQKIAEYVTPDLSAINEKLSVLEKQMENVKSSVNEATDYTGDIKNDLKSDIRRLENVVEGVERSNKQLQRETLADVKAMRDELRDTRREVEREMRQQKAELEKKFKEAVDNPLAGK